MGCDCCHFENSGCPREICGHCYLVGGIEDRRPRAARLERFSCQSERGKTFEVRRFEVESAERREIERRHCRKSHVCTSVTNAHLLSRIFLEKITSASDRT